MNTPWYRAAACNGMDLNDFFPDRHDRFAVADAKALCRACPVRLDCLDDALTEENGRNVNGRFGIRGGYDATERHREYRRRRDVAKRAAAAAEQAAA